MTRAPLAAQSIAHSDPAVTAILAVLVLVLGERITVSGWIGIAVVAVGIVLASLRRPASGAPASGIASAGSTSTPAVSA